jgi:penicillin-binding protein 2
VFERRLKIVLGILVVAGLVLIGRVFDVQVIAHAYWERQSIGVLTRSTITETTRGRILDLHGKPMAIDQACTDACVDYRAITDPPDPKWVTELALDRLKKRPGAYDRKQPPEKRKAVLAAEVASVNNDIRAMWDTLSRLYVPVDDDISGDQKSSVESIRQGIVRGIEMRRRWLWFRQYQQQKIRSAETSKWVKWLAGSTDSGPELDRFAVTLSEQEQPHVILHDLTPETASFLGKRLEQSPGLSLRPSTHRVYPMRTVASNLLGSLHHVTATDLEPNKAALLDEGRRYLPTDLIGRDGIEAYAEPMLRGSRGKIEKQFGSEQVVSHQEFVPGRDVHLSIDSELQAQCQQMLQHVVEYDRNGELVTPADGVSMHAAIVVIDVKTGEVRALVSNPGFDLNDLETHYASLLADTENEPLRDRATSDSLEPGSTVKPLVGLSAITAGKLTPTEGIECTGYLRLPAIGPDGKYTSVTVKMPRGQCWVQSEFSEVVNGKRTLEDHHRVPTAAPHHGIYGNPDGWLSFSDAIERSCDVFFETAADRMGAADMSAWYEKWGFGRTSGIGIYESPGLLETQYRGRLDNPRMTNCYAGMGQDKTQATPLQIANEAATIARNGVWLRPRLLTAEDQAALDTTRGRSAAGDRVDLHLDPAGIEQCRIGMVNVVSGPAGTGSLKRLYADRPAWLTIAGKTGTAETSRLFAESKDAGVGVRQPRTPVVRGGPETASPWYRSEKGDDFVHAWYMGYAPVENPQVAFAVVIEYAGAGGGVAAAPVACHVLDACMQDGLLRQPGTTQP